MLGTIAAFDLRECAVQPPRAPWLRVQDGRGPSATDLGVPKNCRKGTAWTIARSDVTDGPGPRAVSRESFASFVRFAFASPFASRGVYQLDSARTLPLLPNSYTQERSAHIRRPPCYIAQRCRRLKSNALLTAWRPHAATLALEREPSRLRALQGHSYGCIRLLDALRRSYSPTVRCGKISRPAVADVSGGRLVEYVCRD